MATLRSTLLALALVLGLGMALPARPASGQVMAAVAVDPVVGPPGRVVQYVGVGFTPGQRVSILLIRGLGLIVDEPVASATGAVAGSFTMPAPGRLAELTFGRVDVFAIDRATGRETLPAPFLLTRDAALDYALPNGRFFRQTNGTGGEAPTGFSVVNAHPFAYLVRSYDEFQRLGGVPANGFPVTRPFVLDGFVTQAMQKSVFQWRPETERVAFVNVLDELHEVGLDDLLFARYAIPRHLDLRAQEAGLPFSQFMQNRLSFLDANPDLRAFYFSVDDPLLRFGLPTSRVEDFGPFFAVRLQRAALQQWKVDVPWARAGQVVVANGGDLAKEVGLWPAWAATPEEAPTFSASIVVYEPARESTVQGPLRVRGDARAFEAVVAFDLLNEQGQMLASGYTMARTGGPDFGRFDDGLSFRTDRPQRAILRVYQPSARGDATPQFLVPIALELRP